MFRARYAFEVPKQQRHGLLRVNKVDNLLILSALLDTPLYNGLAVVGALGEALGLEHVSHAGLAEGAAALVQDRGDSLFEVKGVPAVVTKQKVIHFLFLNK